MAGGGGTRWGNHMGIPKHIVPVDGERLLDGTVRKLREHGVMDVIVLGPYDVPGARSELPRFTECDTDKFLSTCEHWHDSAQTLVLYGDVWFSNTALRELCRPVDSFRFVGRRDPSTITGSPWGELFGVALSLPGHGRVAHSITTVRQALMNRRIPRGGGWELYRQCVGLSHAEHRTPDHFVNVDDWTDDFDYPEDYDCWLARRASGRVTAHG